MLPSDCIGSVRSRRCLTSRSGPARAVHSQTQRFPFTFPIPGSPANATLDYSIYLPISYSPGLFDLTTGCPTLNTTISPFSAIKPERQ